MRSLLLALLLASPLATRAADLDARFTHLRDGAQPVGSLATFLERYVGGCEGPEAGPSCRDAARAFRAQAAKQAQYVVVDEDAATNVLRPSGFDADTGALALDLTPFFPGGRYALTSAKRPKLDARGNPTVPLLRVQGQAPSDDWDELTLMRLIRGRQLQLHVVFRPQEAWSVAGPGGRKVEGASARLEAVLVTVARTGEPVALWLARP